jgi:hypothetical protein
MNGRPQDLKYKQSVLSLNTLYYKIDKFKDVRIVKNKIKIKTTLKKGLYSAQ